MGCQHDYKIVMYLFGGKVRIHCYKCGSTKEMTEREFEEMKDQTPSSYITTRCRKCGARRGNYRPGQDKTGLCSKCWLKLSKAEKDALRESGEKWQPARSADTPR